MWQNSYSKMAEWFLRGLNIQPLRQCKSFQSSMWARNIAIWMDSQAG